MLKPQVQKILDADDKSILVRAVADKKTTTKENNLKLSHHLQTTLNLKTIFERFITAIQAEVPCDGFSYTNTEAKISVEIGETAEHNFSYRLSIKDEDIGEIKFSRHKKFSDADVLILEDKICLLVYPLKNAIQYNQALQAALQDPLTGIANRAAFDETFQREVEMAKRHAHPLSLINLDIDHFKNINDTYGHAAGDCVLKEITTVMTQCIRNTDMLFRIGGEEFVIILRNTETEGAILLAERIRESTEKINIKYRENDINTTISAGIATYNDRLDAAELLAISDKALYEAKAKGRNRISYPRNSS